MLEFGFGHSHVPQLPRKWKCWQESELLESLEATVPSVWAPRLVRHYEEWAVACWRLSEGVAGVRPATALAVS